MNNFDSQISPSNSICKVDISGFLMDDYRTFDPEGYTILCQVGKISDGLQYFPDTATIIVNNNQQSQLYKNFDQLIPGIASDLQITQEEALKKSYEFFSNAVVRVEPRGIQGHFYKMMKGLQNYVPISHTAEALAIARTTGINGIQTVIHSPLVFVGATYLGSIFFGYAGVVAGNNTVGSIFNVTSYVLSRPMRGVEITLNGLILGPISRVIGLPLVLNGTQELLNGKGLSIEEFSKIGIAFERICNSTVVRKTRKIYDVIRNKD